MFYDKKGTINLLQAVGTETPENEDQELVALPLRKIGKQSELDTQ